MISLQNVDLLIDGKKLIHDISCNIESAGKTVVMGPNGAGKSLFLRLVAGLLKPDDGEVLVNSGKRSIGKRSKISMVFQNPVLLRRTAYANLAYVLKQQKLANHSIAQRVNEALAAAHLQQHAKTSARNLSGGEQQRLALARALVVDPEILLLDEPTANLDPASTYILEKMVDDVSRDGTKIIFITHDVRQAKRIGDDILFIHEGRILTHRKAREFFRDPGSREAQAYLDGRIPGQQLQE